MLPWAVTTGPPRRSLEQLLETAPALFDADERQREVGDLVAHEVPRPVVIEVDEHRPAVDRGRQSAASQRVGQLPGTVFDLDREDARPLREVAQWRGADELAGVDGDEVVAHPLDLAEQVARDDDGDAELRSGPPHEREHLVAAG